MKGLALGVGGGAECMRRVELWWVEKIYRRLLPWRELAKNLLGNVDFFIGGH